MKIRNGEEYARFILPQNFLGIDVAKPGWTLILLREAAMWTDIIQKFRISHPSPSKPPLRPKGRPVDPRVVEKNLFILKKFIHVYCRGHHGRRGRELCVECLDLLNYARTRVEKCPYDPKPKCKECPTHCYKPDYRQRMKAVMRYSGMYYVKRGRIDWLIRYFLAQSV